MFLRNEYVFSLVAYFVTITVLFSPVFFCNKSFTVPPPRQGESLFLTSPQAEAFKNLYEKFIPFDLCNKGQKACYSSSNQPQQASSSNKMMWKDIILFCSRLKYYWRLCKEFLFKECWVYGCPVVEISWPVTSI